MLTQSRLKELLKYNPENGSFERLKNISYERKNIGCIVGGYLQISVDGKQYLAHRLAWMYMEGNFPACGIDHENRNGLDNSWENLRLATKSQNSMNSKVRSDNRSGKTGVSFKKDKNKWRSYITKNGKQISLGLFFEKSAALEARSSAEVEIHGEFSPIWKGRKCQPDCMK